MAPSTCTNSGKFCSSGRIAATSPIIRRSRPGQGVGWSVQTAERAKPARPDGDIASDVSCAGLPDHVDEDQEHRHGDDRVEDESALRAVEREQLAIGAGAACVAEL